MNKKGFTLVEVLVVIVIMSIVATSSVVMYNKSIERRKREEFYSLCEKMEVAAEAYVYDNDISITNTTSQCKVTLANLQSEFLIDDNLVNPITNAIVSDVCVYAYKDANNNVVYDACDGYNFKN